SSESRSNWSSIRSCLSSSFVTDLPQQFPGERSQGAGNNTFRYRYLQACPTLTS
ncbi:hypothetical protein J6590_018698, partial [Homalodisca vitripennis]